MRSRQSPRHRREGEGRTRWYEAAPRFVQHERVHERAQHERLVHERVQRERDEDIAVHTRSPSSSYDEDIVGARCGDLTTLLRRRIGGQDGCDVHLTSV